MGHNVALIIKHKNGHVRKRNEEEDVEMERFRESRMRWR